MRPTIDLTDAELVEFDDGVCDHLPTVKMAREIRRRRTAEHVVPPAIAAGLDRYAKHGLPPGDRLRRILEGDLFGAYARAADDTIAAMPAIIAAISERLHSSTFGSPEAVARYLADCLKLREAFDKPFPGSETP
jgi:hypothetical protein